MQHCVQCKDSCVPSSGAFIWSSVSQSSFTILGSRLAACSESCPAATTDVGADPRRSAKPVAKGFYVTGCILEGVRIVKRG